MAKRIIMLSPFDVLTGNLSGRQELVYGPNDTRAYEAENGKQGAKNYKPRFIGAKRADGKSYFSVRMKSTTVLTSTTRRNMAIIAVTAAIRSALVRNQPTLWQRINDAFAYLKEGGRLPEGQDTFNKWFAANIKEMIVYKRETWSFSYVPLSFTIHNPFNLDDAEALVIKVSTWIKFANWFAFSTNAKSVYYYKIDGILFLGVIRTNDAQAVFSFLLSFTNPNYAATVADLDEDSVDDKITYKGLQVYTEAGVEATSETAPNPSEKMTTVAPDA